MKQLFSVIVLIVLSAFAAGANLAAPLLTDLDVEYTYDRNGNMTSDANKGLEMSWDYNNRLYKVEDDEMTMTFNRTGSGQKLGKSVYVGPNLKDYLRPGVSRSNSLGGYPAFPRDSVLVYPTDSIFHIGNTTLTENFGSYEYVNGKFARLNTSTGYRDSEGTHVYVRDWQGNIRAVVRKDDDGSTVLEQATYYYPYGMPMAESTNPTANRYKYTGKELLTDKGFNCYDYGARFYDPATGIWLSADPLAHEDYGTSPFVFCGANPINRVDRNGKIWETIWDVGNVVYDVVAATYCHIDGDHEAAKGHWVDAGADVVAAIIPFVPAGASKVAKASAEVVESSVKAANKADNVVKGTAKATRVDGVAKAEKAVHGNSKASTKAQHVYEIFDKETGEVVKTGISSGKISKSGKSYRATKQVNTWNKQEGCDKYDSRIVENIPAGPNARVDALKKEQDNADRLRGLGQLKDPDKHKRP